MENDIFVALNGPCCSFDILLNSVLVICVLFPQEGPGPTLQQPVKGLLFSRSMFQLAYQTVILLMVLKRTVLPLVSGVEFILQEIFYLSSFFSLTSLTWLSFFYYINIVPNTGKCFVWIKGHIKMVVYVIMCLEKLFVFVNECIYITSEFRVKKQPFNSTTLNATLESSEINEFFGVGTIFMIIQGTYLLACFVTMTYSWSSIVIYLRRHMKSIVESSSSFSQPQLEAQMRVAVLGIAQSVMYIPFCLYTIFIVVCFDESFYKYFDPNNYIYFTISSLLGACGSICLGYSQSVFRKRFVMFYEGIWRCKV